MSSASSFLDIPSGNSQRPLTISTLSRSSSHSNRPSKLPARFDDTSDYSTTTSVRDPRRSFEGYPNSISSQHQPAKYRNNRFSLPPPRSRYTNVYASPLTRSIVSSGASTSSLGQGVMSDDDNHLFRNAIAEEDDELSSTDPAETVRKLVADLTDKCEDLSRVVTELQNKLGMRLSQNERLAASVKIASQEMEHQKERISNELYKRHPRLKQSVEAATEETEDVLERLPSVDRGLKEIERSYERERQKVSILSTFEMALISQYLEFQALALERYLQWKTARWYIRAHRYLRGERPFNWKDKSAHRRQMIIIALIWSGGVFAAISILIVVILTLRTHFS
ncbi:hypothetical protein FRC03_008904 [Tulasnella sp. 419]|nr:hypothetical protein FRC03_008904 [Tulasnella sp. 419]